MHCEVLHSISGLCTPGVLNDPPGTKLPLVVNHCIDTSMVSAAISINNSSWETAHLKYVADNSISSCKGGKHPWSRKPENCTYPNNDPFRDVGSQQVELVLVSSIQSDHQHEVSNSETAD